MTRTVPPVLNETLDPEQSRAKRKERNKAVRDASVRLGMQLRDKAWRRGEVYCPCCGERMWFPQHETRKGNNSRSSDTDAPEDAPSHAGPLHPDSRWRD